MCLRYAASYDFVLSQLYCVSKHSMRLISIGQSPLPNQIIPLPWQHIKMLFMFI